ncbi:MAG: ATP-binding protein [Tahibacter sp.]
MQNPLRLSDADIPYRERVQEALVDDLYRRALMPVLMLLPILYVFYLVVADSVARRPIIGWIFAGMFLLIGPRLATIIFVERIKRRYPQPRIRLAIFAIFTTLFGFAMAAVNILAAPIITPQQLAMLAIIAAGINSIAIIAMSPSLASYLLYMVPNILSIAIAIVIGPPLEHRSIFLFLIVTNLFSLTFMATTVHLKSRRAILLRLKVDEANAALLQVNQKLKTQIEERMVIEAALGQRNSQLEALNERLASARSQLIQSEKMASIGQLAAGVAHEINNPIAFVRSNMTSLKTYVTDIVSVIDAYEALTTAVNNTESERRTLEELKISTNLSFVRDDIPSLLDESSDGLTRVENIVKNLKKFTHIDEAETQCVDLHEGLENTLGVAAHAIRAKADVVREYGVLPPVDCLPAQINQVFHNLLINAVQSMEQRGTITLRTGVDGDSVWVQIADTGKGIEPALLGRIFDPFFTTKPVGVGPGLGLSISYSIVRQHGGTIEVGSEVGKGTTFTVRLPIKSAPKPEAQ